VRAPLLVLGLTLLASGCATLGPKPEPRPTRTFPAITVEGDPRLARMNDEELFAEGTAAYSAGELERAELLFVRLLTAFPDSRHAAAASYKAGLCAEQLGRWPDARARFAAVANPERGTGEALEAAFRLAEVDYQLGEYQEAAQLLAAIAGRAELGLDTRIKARVQQGICEVELGGLDRAETTLRQALSDWQGATHPRDLDDYYPAQAEFFLGEIYRLHEEDVRLDPNQTAEELGRQLEYKAELLLSAQGHYLRAIRVGNGYWATAAGAEVGALYEGMYRYLSQAPTPVELDAEATEIYRQEVKKKIRVLLTKAISIYESTLDAADRLGTQGAFVEKSRAGLERLKALLVAQDRDQELPGQDAPPAQPQPARHPDRLTPQPESTAPAPDDRVRAG
jgi:tetratricopeptide (TPR) repeat protein